MKEKQYKLNSRQKKWPDLKCRDKTPGKLEMITNKSQKGNSRDFLGGPVTETLPSSAGDTGSIPGQGVQIPHASLPKKKRKKANIKQYLINSMKTFKMVHIKKKSLKK